MTAKACSNARSARRASVRELSRSIAHVDLTLLLGGGIGAGLTIMRIRRARTAAPLLVAGTVAAAAFTLALRVGRRSGASAAELRRALPGDDLIPHPVFTTDRALTIRAAARDIWPWIVQMGYHRGGWYTNRRLDRLIWHINNPSADRILPEYQHLRLGDIVPDGPPGTALFRVAAVDPERALVLLDEGGTHIPGTAFSWAFVLQPRGERETRLQVRARLAYPSSVLMTLVGRLIIGPADFVMVSGQMLRGIKRRAEQVAGADAQPVA